MANNHEYRGLCDLCGQEAESEVAEVVGLTCSFKDCAEENLYHQACVEKYLKSIKCEKNRKSGFNCPRGCGKATKYPEKCKGKITKSHPVTIRSEGNKKRRQAELESLQKIKDSSPPAASIKSDKKSAAGASSSSPSHAGAAVAGGSKRGKPVPTKPVIIRALNVANARLTNLPPPKTAAELQREALQAARDKLRAEIAATNKQLLSSGTSFSSSSTVTASANRSTKPGGGASSSPAIKQVMTLDEYMAARSASNASAGGVGRALATQKLNDTTRSSSAASSAPSAAAASGGGSSSRPSTFNNAWSRMTSLGDQPAATFPSTQSVESFPETPGREMLSSSYAPSEEYAPAPAAYAGPMPTAVRAPVAVRVPVTSVTAVTAPSTGPGTAGTTPRAGATPSAGATPTAAAAATGLSFSFKEIIPGMIDHSKLTKAQRKNLKRAEKKAAARLEETCSLVSCATTGATAEGEDHHHLHSHHQFVVHEEEDDEDASHQHALNMDTNNYLGETPPLQPTSPVHGSTSSGGDTARSSGGGMSQESLECLVQYKLNKTIALLVNMGFNYEASARTAIACGGDVHSAMQDLLVAESGADSVYPPGAETPVDISEELTTVQLLNQRYGGVFSPAALDAVIVQCLGNLGEVVTRLQIQAQNLKVQQQQQQFGHGQRYRQGLFYSTSATNKLSDTTRLAPASHGTASNGDGLGSLFGDTFGLPDELTWGQSASQHPAACSSDEWNSLLGGGGRGESGSLFGTNATTAGQLGSGAVTTNQQNLPSQQHSLFGTSPGLGLGFSSSLSPSYQQHQYQQSAPQLMPGISQQQHHHQQQQGVGSSNFSSNTVLHGGGTMWGSASTIRGSYGTASGGVCNGGIRGSNDTAAAGVTRLSYEANNNGESDYLDQRASTTTLHPAATAANISGAGYGMIKNSDVGQGMGQFQQAYSHHHQQQMQYSGAAGRLWEQQQQQHGRSSFDGNQAYSYTGYYANSPRNDPGAAVGGGTGFNSYTAAGYPGSIMPAMAQEQQQASQDQRELHSLMGSLGLYSS
ncbi:hypothetical protein KSW81_003514 [Nannochloris sp. 'desiccata']|nr:hypothetical protein KSW81_003514 [Chlorella desiccata (nom. nud.)]